MKKNYFKTFDEINEFRNSEILFEIARINDLKSFNVDIFVYGGDSYGTGRNEHGTPHFLYRIKKGDPEYRIQIPSYTEWKTDKTLIFLDNKILPSKLLKQLIKWLDEKSHLNNSITNLEQMYSAWNILNADNKNVKQLPQIIKENN